MVIVLSRFEQRASEDVQWQIAGTGSHHDIAHQPVFPHGQFGQPSRSEPRNRHNVIFSFHDDHPPRQRAVWLMCRSAERPFVRNALE
jgi:hypothetical protein